MRCAVALALLLSACTGGGVPPRGEPPASTGVEEVNAALWAYTLVGNPPRLDRAQHSE